MYDETVLHARGSEVGEAEWAPLERFLPYELCGGFMYMHTTTLEGGIVLHGYKHSETRRYVLLDEHADAWEDIDHGRFKLGRPGGCVQQPLGHRPLARAPPGWSADGDRGRQELGLGAGRYAC